MHAEPPLKDEEGRVPEGTRPPRWKAYNDPAIVFGAVLLAVVVVVGSYLYATSTGPGPACPIAALVGPSDGCGCGGGALSIGTASVGSGPSPTVWYENATVESAATNLFWGDLLFTVETENGGGVSVPLGSHVSIIDGVTGATLLNFTLSNDAWTGDAATAHVTSSQKISLVWAESAKADPLRGDDLALSGTNGYGGCTLVTPLG